MPPFTVIHQCDIFEKALNMVVVKLLVCLNHGSIKYSIRSVPTQGTNGNTAKWGSLVVVILGVLLSGSYLSGYFFVVAGNMLVVVYRVTKSSSCICRQQHFFLFFSWVTILW